MKAELNWHLQGLKSSAQIEVYLETNGQFQDKNKI